MSPLPQPKKATQSDMFLDMLQGPGILVIVGSGSSVKQYMLPVALLCVHSIYLRSEIIRLNDASKAKHANKKRKLSPTEDVDESTEKAAKVEHIESERDGDIDKEVVAKVDSLPDATKDQAEAEKPEMAVRLAGVHPTIFGLFLKFIYQNSYPENVDARAPSLGFKVANISVTPSARSFAWAIEKPNDPVTQAPPAGHMSSLLPTPPSTPLCQSPMSPPPAPTTQAHTDFIPPSVHAWLLAQRLGAMSFMNHCITRIYNAILIGTHFPLTPALMNHVWKETSVNASQGSVKPFSPLRRLLMDILVTYWSRPNPQNPNTPILRSFAYSRTQSPLFSTPLRRAWDTLFDTHKDLREEFIHGLQGGSQLLRVDGYFASSTTIRAEKVVKEMGGAKDMGASISGGGNGSGGKKRPVFVNKVSEDFKKEDAAGAAKPEEKAVKEMGAGEAGGRETGYDVVAVKKEKAYENVVEVAAKQKDGKVETEKA